jgi:localization factor PodJL
LYERGRGVPADPGQATFWYEQAARSGNRKAMHNLAVAYADGSGVEKNLGEAARWFRSAADLGLTDSQFNIAVLYERGMGVPASLSEAYKWYFIASAQGDAEARSRVEALATQLPEDQRLAAEQAANAFAPQPLDMGANEPPTLAQIQ